MKKFKAIVALALTLVALMIVPVFAAPTTPAAGTISAVDGTVAVGDTFEVTVGVTHTNTDGTGIVGTINFDAAKVTLTGATANVGSVTPNLSTGAFVYTSGTVDPIAPTVTLTFTFTAIAVGDPDISVSGVEVQYGDDTTGGDDTVAFAGGTDLTLTVVPGPATGTISVGSDTVVVGGTFNVTAVVSQSHADGTGIVGTINFDDEVVTLTGITAAPAATLVPTLSTGAFTYTNTSPIASSVTFTFTFTAIAVGDPDISMGDVDVQYGTDGVEDVTFSGDADLTVGLAPTPTKTYNDEDDFSWIYDGSSKKPVPVVPVEDGNDDVPATGDSSTMMWTYLALAALGVAGLGAMVAKKVFAK